MMNTTMQNASALENTSGLLWLSKQNVRFVGLIMHIYIYICVCVYKYSPNTFQYSDVNITLKCAIPENGEVFEGSTLFIFWYCLVYISIFIIFRKDSIIGVIITSYTNFTLRVGVVALSIDS